MRRIPLVVVLVGLALACVWLARNADPGVDQQMPHTFVDGEFRREIVHSTTKEAEAFWRRLGVHEAADAYREDLKAIERERMLYAGGALLLFAAAGFVLLRSYAQEPYRRRTRRLAARDAGTAASPPAQAAGPGHDHDESGVCTRVRSRSHRRALPALGGSRTPELTREGPGAESSPPARRRGLKNAIPRRPPSGWPASRAASPRPEPEGSRYQHGAQIV